MSASATPAATARAVQRRLGPRWQARLGIVLGSGFSAVQAAVRPVLEVPYARLPGMPGATVPGHAGTLILGTLAGLPVAVLAGRAHYYEGHTMEVVTFGVRMLAALGIEAILLTNAAGGVRRRLRPGDFMRLTDHVNCMGVNPLRGGAARGGAGFVDLSQTYDPGLGRGLDRAARRVRVRLQRGVYLAVSGPSFETPAEIRAFARFGADAVGMSTVPEAIVARQCGVRVAAVSCITNVAAGLGPAPVSHADVLATGRESGPAATRLLAEFCRAYAATGLGSERRARRLVGDSDFSPGAKED